MKSLLSAFGLSMLLPAAAGAQSDQDPIRISGEARLRLEGLDGQFRAGGSGGDQLLLFRGLLGVEADLGSITFGGELQDARTYLGDSGTPLSPSITNPLDILQAYVRFNAPPSLLGGQAELTLGRQTPEIGSSRNIDRIEFANVIRSYTGAYYRSDSVRGDEFHAFHVVPVERLPTGRDDIDDNVLSGDEEQWGRRFWGLHYRRNDALPALADEIWLEAYLYGFDERDTSDVATPDRSLLTPGLRVYRKPSIGQWDIDLELSGRFGTRYATSDPGDTQSLDVSAARLVAYLGYTFDAPWRPRVALEYYYASGDGDPNDNEYGQYERLFAGRRGDLNNTSIHGPLTPANLSAPGIRVEVKPNARWDARAYYHAASLASDTDSWIVARLRDPTGQSGRFIGHTLDARARYWVVPDRLRLEFGASALIFGEFAKDAPGGPEEEDRTLFGFTSITWSF